MWESKNRRANRWLCCKVRQKQVAGSCKNGKAAARLGSRFAVKGAPPAVGSPPATLEEKERVKNEKEGCTHGAVPLEYGYTIPQKYVRKIVKS